MHTIADWTLRSAAVAAEARSALLDRIRALGKAQDILLAGSAEAASMSALVRSAVEPHAHGGRFRVSGPEIAVGARAALMLALALHELSTNAAKYGALSSPEGTVDIAWSVAAGRGEPVVELVWREGGGPGGRAPAARGLRHAPDRAGLGGDGRRHRHAAIPARRSGLPDRDAAIRLLVPHSLTGPLSAPDADRTPAAMPSEGRDRRASRR